MILVSIIVSIKFNSMIIYKFWLYQIIYLPSTLVILNVVFAFMITCVILLSSGTLSIMNFKFMSVMTDPELHKKRAKVLVKGCVK